MASMKQIKQRKRSVDSTGKITKAMKLVATVKLQKTKQMATDAIPYFLSHKHHFLVYSQYLY